MTWKDLSNPEDDSTQPANKKYGNIGKEIQLKVNHFEVKLKDTELKLYHYDVTVKDFRGSEGLPKPKKMKVFEQMKVSYPAVFSQFPLGYDREKSAFGPALIPQLKKKCKTYKVEYLDKESGASKRSTFHVTLKLVNKASLKDFFNESQSTAIQMLEVMFRHDRTRNYEQIGLHNFFSMKHEFGKPFPVGGSKEGYRGFSAALNPSVCKTGLALVLDVAHAAFYKELPVVKFLKEEGVLYNDYNVEKTLERRYCHKATDVLEGIKVKAIHTTITYKVNKMMELGADKLTFPFKNKDDSVVEMTVLKYFEEHLNRKLEFPSLNCLHVGNVQKNIYIPLELCEIKKGQKVKKMLSDSQTAEFVRETAIPPKDRRKKIEDIVAKNNFPSNPMLQAIGMTISDKMMETTGRVLPSPQLKNLAEVFPRFGKWEIQKGFYLPANLKQWAVLNYDNRTPPAHIDNFIKQLILFGRQAGMKIQEPFDVYNSSSKDPEEDLKYYKENAPKKEELQLVFCILPKKTYKYGRIKLAGDLNLNIITQCVVGRNISKPNNNATIKNLLLKMNCKLGGTHTIYPILRTSLCLDFSNAMVMGADVNHPPASNTTYPSYAAVVASMDAFATRYSVEIRVNGHRTEVIEDMQEITENLLVAWQKANGRLPHMILMYRDGVSNSQFKQVLHLEMMKIRAACTKIKQEYMPGIKFICVQKRHHTRLFCNESDGVGRNKNVPPGTKVDQDITHPGPRNFYLVSHEGLQGTSRPSHYYVLWDDDNDSMNLIQMMTYILCHLYSRCTRSVSIPAPVYYAHHAAFRAKTHVAAFMEKYPESSVQQTLEVLGKRISRMSSKDPYSFANKMYYN